MTSRTPARRLPGPARRYYAALREQDPRTLTSTGLLVALVAALAAFGHLVEDYLTGDPIVRWDVEFARWLHEHSSGPIVQFFKIVTLAGNAAVLAVIVIAIAFALVRRGLANDAALVLLAFGGASVVNALLKLIFHRPRPELAFVHLDTYSFPSGHAAASSATFATLAYLLARRRSSTAARIWIGLGAAAAIALVGFSRLYLGAHYLSDVLAGISFGVAWAAASLLVYTLYGEREVLALIPGSLRRRRPQS
jgi:membrane-associated phospholipid phosphatase